MKFIIISGLSGSGKSVALHTLEDIGYFCTDNLPISMLEAFAVEMESTGIGAEGIAVGIDVRNISEQLGDFKQILHSLWARGIRYTTLFLTCDNDSLLKRFSETRRRHPLSTPERPLQEAIDIEQKLLEPIATAADLTIDTSNSNVHQLRNMVRNRIGYKQQDRLSLLFESFGFKQGVPSDADFVFDVRCLPNPYWDERLRPHTGRDEQVIEFLDKQVDVSDMYQHLESLLSRWIPAFDQDNRSYLTIAVGCTGGKHRSVYLIEKLGAHFKKHYPNVVIRHRELS